jgi:hypothetical protein
MEEVMVSDTLYEAIVQIDAYLEDFPHVYEGDTRTMVLELRDHMEEVRRYLDTPPRTQRELARENEA